MTSFYSTFWFTVQYNNSKWPTVVPLHFPIQFLVCKEQQKGNIKIDLGNFSKKLKPKCSKKRNIRTRDNLQCVGCIPCALPLLVAILIHPCPPHPCRHKLSLQQGLGGHRLPSREPNYAPLSSQLFYLQKPYFYTFRIWVSQTLVSFTRQ